MAKKQVTQCLFCGEIPCACNASEEKKPQKPKLTGSARSDSIPTSIPSSPTPTSSEFLVQKKQSRFKKRVAKNQAEHDEDELLLRQAIRNLESILSPDTKRQYQHVLNPPKDAALLHRQTEVRRSLE